MPFRNSTLTHLLQDSISQDSKTLMFCCISPVTYNVDETFCTLLCVEINRQVGFATRPCWLRRAVRDAQRHAIEQTSRRWRGGRRDDSFRTGTLNFASRVGNVELGKASKQVVGGGGGKSRR